MPRSSQRHNREIYGLDSAGETPEQHGDIWNAPSPSGPSGLVMAVETTTPGETFTLPFRTGFNYDCVIDWGDGEQDEVTTFNDPALTHTYAEAGEHSIQVTGLMETIFFNNAGDKLKVLRVDQLGSTGLVNLYFAFYGCANMTYLGSGDTSQVTTMEGGFRGLESLETFPDLDYSSLVGKGLYNAFSYSGYTTFPSITLPVGLKDMGYAFRSCSNLVSCGAVVGGAPENISAFYFSVHNLVDVDLTQLNVSEVTNAASMLVAADIGVENYDALLLSWSQQSIQPDVPFSAGDAKYTEVAARQVLVDAGWVITDGGPA